MSSLNHLQVEMGLGWPTFRAVIDKEHVEEAMVMGGMPDMLRADQAGENTMGLGRLGMIHTQIRDRRACSMLGYAVLVDGETVYCVDDHALYFVDQANESSIPTQVNSEHPRRRTPADPPRIPSWHQA